MYKVEIPKSDIKRGEMLAHYGKTFNWGAHLLPKKYRERIQQLYAFCRYIDDIADESSSVQSARAQLSEVRDEILSQKSNHPIIHDFLNLMTECEIKPQVVLQLIDGISWDLYHDTINDENELLVYCYGVASTVGIFMCNIHDIKDQTAIRFAIDLGIGMQCSNIARDVLEDAKRGRVYLPKTWLPSTFDRNALISGDELQRNATFDVVKQMVVFGNLYYTSSEKGMIYIPWRSRIGIFAASRIYQEIGKKILKKNSQDYWKSRTHTTTFEKIQMSLSTIFIFLMNPQFYRFDKDNPPIHDPLLHKPIEHLIDEAQLW